MTAEMNNTSSWGNNEVINGKIKESDGLNVKGSIRLKSDPLIGDIYSSPTNFRKISNPFLEKNLAERYGNNREVVVMKSPEGDIVIRLRGEKYYAEIALSSPEGKRGKVIDDSTVITIVEYYNYLTDLAEKKKLGVQQQTRAGLKNLRAELTNYDQIETPTA